MPYSMRKSLKGLAVLFSLVATTRATCVELEGNWYCNEVESISYLNLGKAGTYSQVTSMDASSCACNTATYSYSGPIAPFNEEVSLHFRGPLNLKQFAFYTPSTASSKKRSPEPAAEAEAEADPHAHHHNVARAHQHPHVHAALEERATKKKTTTSSSTSAVVSVTAKEAAKATSTSASSAKTSTSTAAKVSTSASAAKSSSTSVVSSKSSSTASASAAASTATSGSWTRGSYYSSTAGTASGVTFLNLNGGGSGSSDSGTWDSCFGSSLSYSSTSGTAAAGSAQILADTTIPSSAEVILFSGTSCSDGLCGYYRPGSVAYHGFAGPSKIFLFEFAMPNDTTGGNSPAIWMLNALIPLTQEYGSCSCWANTAGCGEFDLFETLSAGQTRMTSSFHSNQASGDSDWIRRPMTGTMKAAVVMDNNQAHIKVLNSAFVFGSTLSATDYANLVAGPDSYVAGSNSSTVTLS